MLSGELAAILAQDKSTAANGEAFQLPMIQRPSADPGLPGNWYILDRTKPVRKYVDRESLLPVGRCHLVMMEQRLEVTYARKPKFPSFVLGVLPVDIGDEQAFLGCHVSLSTANGQAIDYQVAFHQARGHGARVVQLKYLDCPADVPLWVSIKNIVLNPPLLPETAYARITNELMKRVGKRKDWSQVPGFPQSDLAKGGPAFVNTKASPSYFQTIHDVLKATDGLIAYTREPQYVTDDPEKARSNRKGQCSARSRVAEKALLGVARAVSVGCYADKSVVRDLAEAHVTLLIEDPETGKYLRGEVARGAPFLIPHSGDLYFTGGKINEGLPNPLQVPRLEEATRQYNLSAFLSADPTKEIKPFRLIGSSTVGNKDSARYQDWLQKVPGEFRDIEKALRKT
jgi:hypothetical protein